MFSPRRTTSTTAPRLAAPVALALFAGALAGCGSSHKTTAPLVSGPSAPGPMLTLVGDPHGTVTLTGYMLHASAADTVSGYFYLAMTDSVNHPQFATDVTMNGVAMRPERDGLDQPCGATRSCRRISASGSRRGTRSTSRSPTRAVRSGRSR